MMTISGIDMNFLIRLSNIILNSDKEKTSLDQDRISNLTSHNGQKSKDSQIDGLKEGYDNKNNDVMGSMTPKDSAAISMAAIQLEIGNMKERRALVTDNAAAVAISADSFANVAEESAAAAASDAITATSSTDRKSVV